MSIPYDEDLLVDIAMTTGAQPLNRKESMLSKMEGQKKQVYAKFTHTPLAIRMFKNSLQMDMASWYWTTSTPRFRPLLDPANFDQIQ